MSNTNRKNHCIVCNSLTDICCPSPFLPYSGWRCGDCIKAHRIPYKDLLDILNREETNSYEEALESFRQWWKGSDGLGPDNGVEYAEKYLLSTLEFFNKSKDEAWEEANGKKSKASE